MTAKISASADGLKVTIGNSAEDALEIDQTAKTIKALAPYLLKGDISAQSLSGNGYVKLASGLIIQWGLNSIALPVVTSASKTVTFPIAFPNACLSVVASPESANTPAELTKLAAFNCSNLALNQYIQQAYASASINATISFRYIAIGY